MKATKSRPFKPKLIAVDWSGTVSDDRKPVYETTMRILEYYGKQRINIEEFWPKTTLTISEFLLNQGIKEDPVLVNQLHSAIYAKVRKEGMHPTAYKDAKVSLARLKEHDAVLAVISSHPQKHLEREAEEYGIKGYFQKFIGGIQDKTQGILDLCHNIGEAPIKTIYLGDTIFDIRAANKADAVSAAITTGYHTMERLLAERPNIIVDSLSEFQTCMSDLLRTEE